MKKVKTMKKVMIKDKVTQSYIGIVEVYPDEIRLLETEFIVISMQEVHHEKLCRNEQSLPEVKEVASSKTCIQIDSLWNVGGREMFYATKVNDNRVRVVMFGRILFMSSEGYTRWETKMSLHKNTTDEQSQSIDCVFLKWHETR